MINGQVLSCHFKSRRNDIMNNRRRQTISFVQAALAAALSNFRPCLVFMMSPLARLEIKNKNFTEILQK
jgi:hypothetical protein